jgi:glycosyltransferase involved in cell wall biosynthesis
MRRALFIHDHIFSFDESAVYYSEGKITDAVFRRYLDFVDQVAVVSRAKPALIEDICRRTPIKLKAVKFFPVTGSKFQHVFIRFLGANSVLMYRQINVADLVILRLPSFLGLFAFVFVFLMRKKYFIEFVGHPRDALVSAGKSGFGRRVFALLMSALNRFAVRRANGVIYVTKSALQAEYPTRGFSQYASNVELHVGPGSRSFGCYAIKGDVPVIGMIGSFNNAYKGVDVAIRAIAHLKERGVTCHLRVLGSGDRRFYDSVAAECGVEELIFFDGVRLGGAQVYEWLDGLDIYAQPSRTEGLPRSLIEAMSRGLPCISSDAGGMPELLSNNYIFPVDSCVGMADRVLWLLESSDLRRESGMANYDVARQYDFDVLAARRKDFWGRAAHEVFDQ